MTKEEYYIKRFLDFPPNMIEFDEIQWAKYHIRTLQQENEELHNKFKKVINIINVDGYDCKNRDEFEKVLGKLLIELNISCKNKQKN